MLNLQSAVTDAFILLAQAEPLPVWIGSAECDLWTYRSRTLALLRRYAKASVEVGRLPSLLGREFFRSRVTSYSMRNFEDVVIFVADMEHVLDQLSKFDRKLLAMNVLEEYSIPEVAQILQCPKRTVERELQSAINNLSRLLLKVGVMES